MMDASLEERVDRLIAEGERLHGRVTHLLDQAEGTSVELDRELNDRQHR